MSAASAVVDVSSADSRQQCRSNGWQNTLELRPTEPSGIRSAALRCQTRQSAECRAVQSKKSNEPALKAMRRTRARYGLHGAVEGMANNERGLRQSRTPHARSSCIIGHFLTIAWGTQILAIGGSQVRSYDRRTVSVEWSVRRANCKRFTHIRPTDGSGPTTVGWSGERRSQWRCMDRLGCSTLRRFQRLLVLFLL